MEYKIYFRTDEFYGLTRRIFKGEFAQDNFGNISMLSAILTVICFPIFLILDTVVLPFLLLNSIYVRKKDKRDLVHKKIDYRS